MLELYQQSHHYKLQQFVLSLQNYLNPSDEDDTETTTTSNGVTASTTPTSNTGTTATPKKEKVEDAFDELFNS